MVRFVEIDNQLVLVDNILSVLFQYGNGRLDSGGILPAIQVSFKGGQTKIFRVKDNTEIDRVRDVLKDIS